MNFTGEESEKEFFEKSLEYWELVLDLGVSDMIKLIKIATIFHEMRHRLDELQ
jgi:hypothetical protein